MSFLYSIWLAYSKWKDIFWFDMPSYPHLWEYVTLEELRLDFFDALSGIENDEPFWMRAKKEAKHLEKIFNELN